ncbi:MAG: sodium/proline symporter PutP [Calditrichaeota bacterium]|nr:MAG: sodium/proline symporter PutP [Calditrichota bacterium]
MISLLLPFLTYLILMVLIGLFFFKRSHNLSDYYLGGRRLNSWVSSLSAQASDMSGWLLMGLPGYAYIHGMEAGWIAGGLLLGTYLNWKFVAQRLRLMTFDAGDSITLPEYFSNRFVNSPIMLRVVSAFFILFFFLIYTASGFVAGAKLFSTVFSLPYLTGLIIGAAVIISYTFLGGFWAVSWTDVIQGMMMFLALLIVPIWTCLSLGGFAATVSELYKMNPELLTITRSIDGRPLSWMMIFSLTGWGLGYFGQPHILARFMAIRSGEAIPFARHIAMVWVTLSLMGALLIGLIANVYLPEPLASADAETVFMVMVRSLSTPFIAGCLLSAILAAIMSTADSQLLVASSALTEDFYHAFLRRSASQRELIWVSRSTVLGIAMLAFVLALNPRSGVFDLVSYAWAGFGAAFGPLVLFSLYWRGMTAAGAMSGIIVGGTTVLIWKQLSGGIFELYEIVPGFIFSSLSIYVVSQCAKCGPLASAIDQVKASLQRLSRSSAKPWRSANSNNTDHSQEK